MQKHTIFYYTERGGLSTFETSVVKLLLEDEEFFERHINHINQNVFQNPSFREIVGLLKDAWLENGIHLSPDVLYLRYKRKTEDKIYLEEFEEALNVCKQHPMSEKRKEEVDNEVRYWSLFVLYAYATNHAKDTLYTDKICSDDQLKNAAKRMIEDVERLKDALEGLDDGKKGHNDWD